MVNPQLETIVARLRQQAAASALRRQALLLNGWSPIVVPPSPDVQMLMASMRSDAAFRQLSDARRYGHRDDISSHPARADAASTQGPIDEKTKAISTAAKPEARARKQLPASERKKGRKRLACDENVKKYKKEFGDPMLPMGYPAIASRPARADAAPTQRPIDEKTKAISTAAMPEARARKQPPASDKKNGRKRLECDENVKKYKKEFGDSMVPMGYPAVASIRPARADAAPTQRPKDEKPEAISTAAKPEARARRKPPAPDNKNAQKWLACYENLKKYKEEFGDCMVPRGYLTDSRLSSWVAEQRKQRKLLKDGKPSSMTPERFKLLEQLGFAWNAQEAAWEKHMVDLKEYKAEYGDCIVPLDLPKYPKLGLWVKEQRRHRTLMKQGRHSHMTPERIRALDELDFCWDAHEAVWGERLKELCEYKAVHGNTLVPTSWPANPKLGTWVHHQRRQYKKFKGGKSCHMTPERIRVLEDIGFVWSASRRYTKSSPPSVKDRKRAPSPQDSSQKNPKPRRRRRVYI